MGFSAYVSASRPARVAKGTLARLAEVLESRADQLPWACESPCALHDKTTVSFGAKLQQPDSDAQYDELIQIAGLGLLLSNVTPEWLWHVADDLDVIEMALEQPLWIQAGRAVSVTAAGTARQRVRAAKELHERLHEELRRVLGPSIDAFADPLREWRAPKRLQALAERVRGRACDDDGDDDLEVEDGWRAPELPPGFFDEHDWLPLAGGFACAPRLRVEHPGAELAIVAPTGRLLASYGHRDRCLRVWRVDDGSPLHALEIAEAYELGGFLGDDCVAGATDAGVLVHDLAEGKETRLPGTKLPIACSSDGSTLVATLKVLRGGAWQELPEPTARLPSGAFLGGLELAYDGAMLALAYPQREHLAVADVHRGTWVWERRFERRDLASAAVSPSGRWLVYFDGTCGHVVSLPEGTERCALPPDAIRSPSGAYGSVTQTCFVDDDHLVASYRDYGLALWDLRTETAQPLLRAPHATIRGLRFSARHGLLSFVMNDAVVVAELTGGARVAWDANSGRGPNMIPPPGEETRSMWREIRGRYRVSRTAKHLAEENGYRIAFSPDGEHLAACYHPEGSVSLWNVRGATRVGRVAVRGLKGLVGFHPADRLLVETVCGIQSVDFSKKKKHHVVHRTDRGMARVSADGSTLFHHTDGPNPVDPRFALRGAHEATLEVPVTDRKRLCNVAGAGISRSGAHLFVQWWDLERDDFLVTIAVGGRWQGPPLALPGRSTVLMSPDGTNLALFGPGLGCRVVRDGGTRCALPVERLRELGSSIEPTEAACFIDEDHLVVAYRGIGVVLWDLSSLEPQLLLDGPREWVQCIQITPDRRWLAVALQKSIEISELSDGPP